MFPYEDTYVFTMREASELLAQGKYDYLLDEIIKKFKHLESSCDFILCIGSDLIGDSSAFEFDINVEIAHNLGSPVLVLASAAGNEIEEIVDHTKFALDLFDERGCQLLGTIVNRADSGQIEGLYKTLREQLSHQEMFISVIPENRILDSPTIKEIAEQLNAEILYGHDRMERQAYRYMVVAMQVQNYLDRLTDNALIITPGDRGEVILSALQAHQSRNYPMLAGMLLSTGLKPAASIQKLLDGLPSVLPILAVETETYETASRIGAIRSYITADNKKKIGLSLKLFERYVDTDTLESLISSIESRGMTPKMFLYNLIQTAKADKKHIVLPEGAEVRILQAAEFLLDQDVVDITLLGNEDEIRQVIRRKGLNIALEKLRIVEPQAAPQFEDYVGNPV
jgi:phosphate acetyltransferase